MTQSSSNFIHEMRPAASSTGIPANTPVTWFVDQAIDLAAIQAELLVLVNGTPVSGTFSLAGDGRILSFSPAAPFPPGALVSFYERTSILGLNQYNAPFFTIASVPDGVLRYVRTTIGTSYALDSVFEIEFTQDPPLGQTISALTFGTGNGSSVPVAFTESIPRPHVLRLTTTAPRKPGYYTVAFTNLVFSNAYLAGSQTASLNATTVGGTAAVTSAGPVSGATAVPVNASVRVLFGAAINPLSVTRQSATMSVGGNVLEEQITYPTNNQEIILRPLQALPPNTTVNVQLTGLQDLAGRAIPSISWSFTTGVDPDYTGPTLLSASLPAVNTSGTFQIASNESVQLVFSEPVDPGITVQIGLSLGVGWQTNAATFTLSQDLRTLTIAPVGAWAEGQQYALNLQTLMDLSGNSGSAQGAYSYSLGFQVAFAPSTTPPNLLAISPPDGGTAMPLNARIIAAFDKPIAVPLSGVSLTDSAGNAVALTPLYSNDPAQAVFAPVLALKPDTTYSLSISTASDMSGNLMQSATSASFVTGEVTDYVRPSATVETVTPLPTNMPIRIRFDKPISPATVTPKQIQLLSGNAPQPASLALSGDGLSITVNPTQPLIAGKSYALSVVSPTDFAGNVAKVISPVACCSGYTTTFVAGSSDDTTPPVVTFFPPDGTTGFPVNRIPYAGYQGGINLSVTFSKPVDIVASPPQLLVFENGNPVPGTVGITSTGVTFVPSQLLDYNATYQMQVSNAVDYIGNAAPTATASFTTSQSAAADRATFSVVSMQPADGSVGIDNYSPIVVTFNQMLNPAYVPIQISSSSALPIFRTTSLNGSTVTFTPTDPWPSASTISVSVPQYGYQGYFLDLAGTELDKYYLFSFTAAVLPNATAPTLVSITPAPGTPLSPVSTTFTLVFSEPVGVGAQSLQYYNGSQGGSLSPYYSRTGSVVTATVYPTANSVLTIVGTSGIHDGAGNSIQPFSFQYPTLATDQTANPAVSSISPNNYASNVAPSTPIKIQFNKPMDPNSVLASVVVTQNGVQIPGQLQMLDSNQSVQFTPNPPYQAGARIDTFVLTTAADPSGNLLPQQYQSYFTVAAASASLEPHMSVAFAGFGDAVVPETALDLAFDRDLDVSTVSETNVWLRAGHTRIPGVVALRNSHTLRFQPSQPLSAGEQYVLTTGPNLRSAEGLANYPREFRFLVDPAAPEVHVESVEYLSGSTPLTVRIRFTAPVSPISIDGLKLLAADGSQVHASARFSTDGREWLLALPTPQTVRVMFDGVEDRCGRKLPRESREPAVAK